jgi:hypothetical protein
VIKLILPLLTAGYAAVALVFGLAAVALLALAGMELWQAVSTPGIALPERASLVLESIGLVTVALMGMEMAQTVIEEEVVRRVHVSAPTRVRRYLSRFLVVVVVALAIESLVGVMRALHSESVNLVQPAATAIGAAALLAAWGLFVSLNRSVEELEPEGIREAQQEDRKVQ